MAGTMIKAAALKMLWHNKARLVVSIVGTGFTFFLAVAQLGLLIGWCDITSAIPRHANVDVWVMAPQAPAFDYGTAIPRNRIYQVRNIKGVKWAEGMFVAWNIWQRSDGHRVNVELVGLDTSSVGGPWEMVQGTVELVHLPHSVIIDQLYLDRLGVKNIGDEMEMSGERAVVRGFSWGVRTFTTLPFIFTSIESAIKYDRRYRDDEITYVLVRCTDGYTPESVRTAIANTIPNIEALTSNEFVLRTMQYWMLETGAGITIAITALLGFVVAAVIMSQTLYGITQDHLSNYVTLLALGFDRWKLVNVILIQSLVIGLAGIVLGTIAFMYASQVSATTPIPLEMTGLVYLGLIATLIACCMMAALLSLRSIFSIDPVTVFSN